MTRIAGQIADGVFNQYAANPAEVAESRWSASGGIRKQAKAPDRLKSSAKVRCSIAHGDASRPRRVGARSHLLCLGLTATDAMVTLSDAWGLVPKWKR